MEPMGFLGTPEQSVEVVCCSCEHCCAMGRENAVAIRQRHEVLLPLWADWCLTLHLSAFSHVATRPAGSIYGIPF